MQKNLYYEAIFRRSNVFKELLLGFFFTISSWPRLILEVFLRKNMGERYFSLFHVVLISLFLFGIPLAIFSKGYGSPTRAFKELPVWYSFLVLFLIASYFRNREIARLPSVFDFERFSLSTGIPYAFFKELLPRTNIRQISTLLEPALCFLIGLFLFWLEKPVGILIILCSIIYSLSYAASYHQGDNFVMDQIDKMICNEELSASFVDGKEPSKTRGFEAYGRRPADPEMRRKVAESFFADGDDTDADEAR